MNITHIDFYPDGSVKKSEKEVPDDYFTSRIKPYVPTTEERLAALESAMLSMMGVSTDV